MMLDQKDQDSAAIAPSDYKWPSSSVVAFGVLLLVVLIQLGTGPAWMYTDYSIDPWVYHGYFLHLQSHAVDFNGTYYGTRLAWILPGYVAHHFFSPLVANFLLRLYVYSLALFSIFAFVRRSYGVRCALLTGLLLCATTEFLYQAGWDYVYAIGIAYMLLGVEEGSAAVERLREHASSGWWKSGAVYRAVFAGAAFAAAIHTNFFVFILLPVAGWVIFGRARWNSIFLGVPAIAGAGILTAALGLVNVALKGPFLFFMPNVVVSLSLMKANPWFFEASKWIGHAWWLVTPIAVSMVSIGFIARLAIVRRARRSADDFIRMVDAASLILALSGFVLLTARGMPVLQYDYYGSYLTIFLLIAVAALIGRSLDSWKAPFFNALAGAAAVVAVLVGSSFPFSQYIFRRILPRSSIRELILPLGLGLLLAVLVNRRVLSSLAAFGLSGFVLLQLAAASWRGDGTLGRQAYLDVTIESRELGRLSHDQPLWFWYSWSKQPDAAHYTSLAGTYLWGYRVVGALMPDSTDLAFDHLNPGTFLAIMDNSPAVLEQAVAVLEANGVAVKTVGSSAGTTRHLISLVEVIRRNPPPSWESRVRTHAGLTSARELLNYDLPHLVQHLTNSADGHQFSADAPALLGVFHNTQAHNHLETPFQQCDGPVSITALDVSDAVDTQPETFGPMKMLVQDQDYRTLFSNNAPSNAGDLATVALPAGTHAIRLAFLANQQGYIRLPRQVRIVGLKGN